MIKIFLNEISIMELEGFSYEDALECNFKILGIDATAYFVKHYPSKKVTEIYLEDNNSIKEINLIYKKQHDDICSNKTIQAMRDLGVELNARLQNI